MSSIMAIVVSNYKEIMDSHRDPIVDSWFLMSSPGPIITILAIYLLFVLKIGPKMMESRPAFQLKNTLVLYNAFQVVFSVWLCSKVTEFDFVQALLPNGQSCKPPTSENKELQYLILSSGWWYFFAKVIELLDTVFFVLRKKQNQVSFLHVYHHTVTCLFSWCYLKIMPGEQGIIIGFLNSLVHIVMYTYYAIAALGPEYRKYLWWKKYMTWMQLIQFGIMLFYLMSILALDCGMAKSLTYFFVTNVIIFLYLFGDFYRKTYTKKKV